MYVYYTYVHVGVNVVKVVCRAQKLIELFGEICRHHECNAKQVVTYSIIGCCIMIKGLCEHGHCFTWESSDKLCSQVFGWRYIDNLEFASALMLSGNNYRKIAIFAKFYNQQIIRQTAFYMCQRNLICHGVDSYYKSEQVSGMGRLSRIFIIIEKAYFKCLG